MANAAELTTLGLQILLDSPYLRTEPYPMNTRYLLNSLLTIGVLAMLIPFVRLSRKTYEQKVEEARSGRRQQPDGADVSHS